MQSGTSPLAVTVRHAGKIQTGDTVFINGLTGTTYAATRTSSTVVTLSGFAGTLVVATGDRLVPSNNQPTIYADDQAGTSVSQPLLTGGNGTISQWIEFGAYEHTETPVGSLTTTLYQSIVAPSQAPGQIRFADEFQYGSSTGGIQEALNDVPSGGVVALSGGVTYIPTVAITVPSNVTIDGRGATIQRSAPLDALNIFKDTGTALSNVTIRNITFDNNSRVASAKDIDFTGGATDITIERNRWINLTGRTSDLTRIQTSATAGKRIAMRGNTVSGPGGQQTYNSFQVFDCENIDISNNIDDGYGGFKVEGALAPLLFNWNVSNNVLKNVDQSNMLLRIQGASSVRSVSVTGNSMTNAGKAAIVLNAVAASDTGTINNASIVGNTVRGYAVSLTDSGITIGGVVTSGTNYCIGVAISGNSVDALKSDGTNPGISDRGILVSAGCQSVSVTGNTTRNCGRAGIGLSGQDYTVTGNLIERCVTRDTTGTPPTPAQEGGIAVYGNGVYTTKRIVIANNVVKNCGVSGAIKSYGITLEANATGTVANLDVHGNLCYDDQGTPTQDYGIIIGSAGNPGPNNSLILFNDCRNNATGGISGPLGTATGIFLIGNIPNDGVTQNITAVGNAIVASADRILLNPNGVYTLTSTPTIADGFYNGQLIELLNVSANALTVQDQGTLPSSNLRLQAATIALGTRDSLILRYDTTIGDWVQVGQTNVI